MQRAEHDTSGIGKRALLLLFLLPLVAAAAKGAESDRFPGPVVGDRTVDIQDHVESLYNDRDYRRALLIYEKQLAPQGDKYAQYMVGYMHLTGRGTAIDEAKALAWYRLAAERADRPFAQARDALAARLATTELERAATLHADLLPRYGDRRLLIDLVAADIRFLERNAGRPTGNTLVSGFLGGRSVDHEALTRDRLRERLQWLDEMPAVAALAEREQKLREQADAYLD